MAVKAQWDRDTRTCCRVGCSRPRAQAEPGEPTPVMCRYHIDSFIARCEAIANAHTPPAPTVTVTHRLPTDDRDVCPRCGTGDAIEHGRSGC